jgi:hypothetical protein
MEGFTKLSSYAGIQVVSSFFGSLASFIMMFAPRADPELAILGLVFFFSFILAPVIITFRDIFEAIDAFRKVRYEYFGLSFVSLDTLRIIGSIAVVFFVFSVGVMGFIVFLKLNIAWIFDIFYGAINIFIWAAQLFHMGILSFLWSLKDFLGDPFFQLASTLIAVTFCTNLVPGTLGLFVWIYSGLASSSFTFSSFTIWSQMAGFFVANMVAWGLVYYDCIFVKRSLSSCRLYVAYRVRAAW